MPFDQIETPSIEVTSASETQLRRKRPLRTYGRQSREQENVLPTKRKGDFVPSLKPKDEKENIEKASPETTQALPQPQSPEVPNKPVATRGSILSYFRLLPPPPTSEVSIPEPLSEATTPLSSPPPEPKPRKRRRLTTRPSLEPENVITREECLTGSYGQSSLARSDSNEDIRSCIVVRQYGNAEECSEVPAASTASSSARSSPALSPNKEKKKAEKQQRKPKVKEMVQTVLSLSINKDPGIIICKDCGILYNPLNEKDRKEHKRRHAAHVRSQVRFGTAKATP